MGGRLTRERPELRGHNLFLSRRPVTPGQSVVWELGHLPILAIRAVAEDGREVDLLNHVGTHTTQWSVFQARHLYVGADRNADQMIYSRANQGDVRYFLDWTTPAGGPWTIYWLERLEPAFKYSGFLLDSLSLEATQARIALNFQWYYDRFASLFGQTIGGFYCAEPPQNNWTHDLFPRFQARFGYALQERFFQLGYGADEKTAQVRMDFKRLVADLFADHYVAPVTRWCKDRGVQFWARLEGDESIEVQSDLRGGIYPAVRHFDVPVFDLVNGLQFGDPGHARLNTGMNFCNSMNACRAACLLGEAIPHDARVEKIEESFQTLHQRLLNDHIPADILDERALEEATVSGNQLIAGKQRYRTLILPFAPYLSPAARCNLEAFAKAGGSVLENADHLPRSGSTGIPAGCYARMYCEGATRLVLLFNHTSRPIEKKGLESRYTEIPLNPHAPETDFLPPTSLSLWREGAGRVARPAAARTSELPASDWAVEMPLNAVVLEDWNLKIVRSGKMDMERPTPASFGIVTGKPAPIYQQVELRGHEHRKYDCSYTMAPDGYKPIGGASPFPLHVAYRCHFILEQEVLDSLHLVMESEGVAGAWRMFVNRQLVPTGEFEAGASAIH